jgi:hypothetical protein
MKKLMKKLAIALLAILPLVTLSLILPRKVSAASEWAVGEWKLSTDYSDADHQTTFTGRLRIEREGRRLSGRIYFDTLGEWERLEDVEVTHETVSFTRPKYKQRYFGHRDRGRMEGTYKDHLHHGEFAWRAERE